MPYRDLRPDEAHAAIQGDPSLRVLDVRTDWEYSMHRVDGAVLIPIQELAQRVGELDPDQRYVVVCEHGVRSIAACEFLSEHGFDALSNVAGGMTAWLAAGLPHVTG